MEGPQHLEKDKIELVWTFVIPVRRGDVDAESCWPQPHWCLRIVALEKTAANIMNSASYQRIHRKLTWSDVNLTWLLWTPIGQIPARLAILRREKAKPRKTDVDEKAKGRQTKFAILSGLRSTLPYTLLKIETGVELSLAEWFQKGVTTLRIDDIARRRLKIYQRTLPISGNNEKQIYSRFSRVLRQ